MSVREQEESFSHMNWPPQSPDFNPMECFWDVLKKTEGMVPLSCHQYKISANKCIQLWMEINVVTLHKVVETMPQKMRSVNKTKGSPTKY